MMDNRVFDVNGQGDEMLLATLKLVFKQEDAGGADGWIFDKEKGLVLLWTIPSDAVDYPANKFMVSASAEDCLPFVSKWLKTNQAASVPLKGWFDTTDHDGDNEDGWRVYCEGWGHVGQHIYAICAITPAVLWLGK